jgi:hypothetical protein
MIAELASRVFQARDVAHRAHWSTRSYAAHVALGGFYSDSIDAIDAIVEAYQGQFAPIESFDVKTEKISDIASYLQEEADWIEANRGEIANDSPCIENLIDTLTAVYCKTIFLLGLK